MWVVSSVQHTYGPFVSEEAAERWADQMGYTYSYDRVHEVEPSPPIPESDFAVDDVVMVYDNRMKKHGPARVVAADHNIAIVEPMPEATSWFDPSIDEVVQHADLPPNNSYRRVRQWRMHRAEKKEVWM